MPKKIHRRPDADPKEGVKKYGRTTFADQVNNKYPIDTPGGNGEAWVPKKEAAPIVGTISPAA